MKVRINSCYGEMEMETKVRSSFDQDCAGQNVDIWGNIEVIEVNDTFYMENLITLQERIL